MVLAAVNTELEPSLRLATGARIVLIVEYDGTRYHGSQLQAGLPTIQGEMEKALWKLTGRSTRVAAASRTDAGVHAWGQVISFKTVAPYSTETLVKALNHYLPRDIAVKASYRVRDSFNVRRQAVSREYNYHILNSLTRSPLGQGFAHFVGRQLDVAAMNEACQALIGEHDFASFCSGAWDEVKSTLRRVHQAEVKRDGQLVVFKMVANAFLPHQVRSTVGTLIRIGLGKLNGDEFRSIMEARKPGLAGPTAPACGLYLMQVNYPRPLEEEIW